jgi:hypothetical protein
MLRRCRFARNEFPSAFAKMSGSEMWRVSLFQPQVLKIPPGRHAIAFLAIHAEAGG